MGRRLLLTLAFPPDIGGMQNFAYARCKAWPAEEIIVVAPEIDGWEPFDSRQPFQIHRWRNFLGSVPGARRLVQFALPLIKALGILRHQSIEAIECWQPLPFGLIALLLNQAFSVPYIVWSHGNDIRRPLRYPLARPLMRLALDHAALIVANTSDTKTELLRLQQPPHRITVIHPLIDPDRFHPDIDGSRVISKHGLAGRRILLTVARLDEVKGIDIVMRAMPHVLDAVPDAVYLIVGDGPLRERLETLASELGISDHVILAGRVDYWSEELPQYYNACDVFVMTSRGTTRRGETESFGMAYVEAGACGKPVIGSRVGGVQEAIRDGVTGLLVDPTDVGDVANAVIRLLTDDLLAREMGRNGRGFAVSQSDPSALEQVLEIAH